MTLGPTLIKKCSACGQMIEEWTIMSGNDVGAVYWTDGECFAMMLPDLPELVKCPRCGELLWIYELELLGEKEGHSAFRVRELLLAKQEPAGGKAGDLAGEDRGKMGNRRKDFSGSLPYNDPAAADYFAMLKKGVSGSAKVLYLRLKGWRAGNDERRESAECPGMFKTPGGGANPPLSNDEIENMRVLADLLKEKKHDERLLKAEIMRELGLFDQALALLARPFKPELKSIAAFIWELAEKKDPWVRELSSG
jgi:hypothetical protein